MIVEQCHTCDKRFPESETEIHHVMYKPQVVVIVCKECHERIHHQDGFHDELDPNSEVEWEIHKTLDMYE